MRQVLVDYARRRKAAKRGGGVISVTLGDEPQPADASAEDLLALDEALEQLDPRQRQVIECRFFGGIEEKDIAAALGVSERTVRRDWVKARAWLYQSLYPDRAVRRCKEASSGADRCTSSHSSAPPSPPPR